MEHQIDTTPIFLVYKKKTPNFENKYELCVLEICDGDLTIVKAYSIHQFLRTATTIIAIDGTHVGYFDESQTNMAVEISMRFAAK